MLRSPKLKTRTPASIPSAIVEPPTPPTPPVVEPQAPTISTSATTSPAPEPVNVDPDFAELKAFKAKLRKGGFPEPSEDAKQAARARLVAAGVNSRWSSYAARYGFEGEVFEAIFRTLASVYLADPGWVFEASIAVRRAGLDLSTLSYPTIKGAIDAWRAERKPDQPAETETR